MTILACKSGPPRTVIAVMIVRVEQFWFYSHVYTRSANTVGHEFGQVEKVVAICGRMMRTLI